jgi:hypothetical protein
MNAFVQMNPGQWALAFDQPYFHPGSDMAEWLVRFTTWGGGWDGHRATEMFLVHEIQSVKPKTYFTTGGERFHRECVVAACETSAAAIELRDSFFAIGVETTTAVEEEMHRLVQPFAERKEAEALERIHACFPHIFGSGA